MNKLSHDKRAQALQMMAEGISLRAMTRLTGISRTTLLKLLVDAGQAFSEFQDRTLVDLTCKRVQVDEAWAFCYAKKKNVPTAKAAPEGAETFGRGLGSMPTRSLLHLGTSALVAAKRP